MSTIPLTFDQTYAERTVVGGFYDADDTGAQKISVVLLNRGGRYYRTSVFEQLAERGLSSIISIESSDGVPLDFESLTGRFPRVKFVIPQRKLSVGEMINIGIAESKTPYCLVMWNDTQLSNTGIHQLLVDKICGSNAVCLAPLLVNQKRESLPTLMMPVLERSSLRVERLLCSRELSSTIYAADFMGLYHRERFIAMEGFDSKISDPYWQNLDFGFRSHLWSFPIRISTTFKIMYEGDVPIETIISNDSYTHFFLKNIAVVKRQKNDNAVLPLSRLFGYLILSGKNLFDGLRSFFGVRRWIQNHRTLFITDGMTVISEWDLPREGISE